ncbi:MAG: hypothetical protein ACREQI_11120 [Candidatus Binataceae bacterium]
MGSKAFYKSKTFWAGLMSIITGISIVAQSGHLSADAIAAIFAGAGAILGRTNAAAPLRLADSPAAGLAAAQKEVRQAKTEAAKAGQGWNPLSGD